MQDDLLHVWFHILSYSPNSEDVTAQNHDAFYKGKVAVHPRCSNKAEFMSQHVSLRKSLWFWKQVSMSGCLKLSRNSVKYGGDNHRRALET